MTDYGKWFKKEFPHLKIDRWSILPDTAYFLYHLVSDNKPQYILELGSGLSTVVIAKAADQYGGQIYSLEHQKEWIEKNMKICETSGTDNYQIIYAPLIEASFTGIPNYLIYDPDKIPRKRYNFIFIDGPPTGSPGRRGALYTILPYLESKAIIALDDAHRVEERLAVIEWMSIFGAALSIKYLKFERPAFLIEVDTSSYLHEI